MQIISLDKKGVHVNFSYLSTKYMLWVQICHCVVFTNEYPQHYVFLEKIFLVEETISSLEIREITMIMKGDIVHHVYPKYSHRHA